MSKSIVTEYTEISAISGKPAECRHHLLFGRGIRRLAEEDSVWVPLTNSEHNMSSRGTINQLHGNPIAEKLSKIAGQLAWEKEYYRERIGDEEDISRREFRKRYGISYL